MTNDEKSVSPDEPDDETIEEPKFVLGNLPPPPEVHFHRPTMLVKEEKIIEQKRLSGSDPSAQAYKLGAGLAAAVLFGACIVTGLLIGGFLDSRFPKIDPWGLIIFTVLGFVSGLVNLFRLLGIKSDGKGQK
jgi:F0F1-type ATP synthase assembly protein I